MTAPTLGDVATCRTCHKSIEFAMTSEQGGLPRMLWTDGHRSSPTVCFSAASLRHSPA